MATLNADAHVLHNQSSRNLATTDRNGLPPRRPTSARASFVQQKLQSALSQAEKTAAEVAVVPVESPTSFRTSDEQLCDRSVARYRNDAAIVSFADASNPFAYASNFMPGTHFYTFLAAKDTSAASKTSHNSTGEAAGRGGGDVSEDHHSADASDPSKPPQPLAAVRKPTPLRMWIPDTVVYGETGRAIWLYTDKDGFVQRATDFGEKQVLEKLGTPDSDTERVIVYKEAVVSSVKRTSKHHSESGAPALTSLGNQLRLLTPGELKILLSNGMVSRKPFALQQFVRCNGAKAFIVRSVHESGKPAYAWMISNTVPFQETTSPSPSQLAATSGSLEGGPESTAVASTPPVLASPRPQSQSRLSNTLETGPVESTSSAPQALAAATTTIPLVNRLCTSIQVDKSCTFVKLNERGCATVSELNLRLVKYVEQRLHLQLQTLVADYMKDAKGQWWLLQVKAFRVKHNSNHHPDRVFSLPIKTRVQYLGYRDSSVLEANSDSDDDLGGDHGHGHGKQHAKHTSTTHSTIPLAQRQIRKLVQCKCCLASYPKSELSFKMTLKMITETLVRIRARLPSEKHYAFLSAATALSSESPDASLAYESWSVCSFCYAIYERDQQLKRIETKFSAMLGVPNPANAADGLSRINQDHSSAFDPDAMMGGSVLPSQLTLCRLVLVFNAIYDIPKELYEAEQTHFEHIPVGARKTKTLRAIASKLYLRITALGYTECVPLRAEDIEIAHDRAPRGAALRKASTVNAFECDENTEEQQQSEDSHVHDGDQQRNYWLPINLIRTIHFFAPRTPLQSKLKDTSGIASLLSDENSILVQFIRATEPPLQDPTTRTKRTKKKRRAALIPDAASLSDMVSEMQLPHHSVLLGSTKIRMAQFRSAYVTKIDFYACMALSGEMFNIKGNIGLQRLRYVDAKFLTSQYRLRVFHGVFIPDDSYVTNDPLSPEWMDALRVSFHKQAQRSSSAAAVVAPLEAEDDGDNDGDEGAMGKTTPKHARASQSRSLSNYKRSLKNTASRQIISRSMTSLSGDNEEMDAELEQMIDQVHSDQQRQASAIRRTNNGTMRSASSLLQPEGLLVEGGGGDGDNNQEGSCSKNANYDEETPMTPAATLAELKQELLPSTKLPSRYDAQVSMLLKKTVLSPRSAFADVAVGGSSPTSAPNSARGSHHHALLPSHSQSPLSPRNRKWLWCLVILLNEAHYLQSREHSFCRWECHYSLLQQKRSAVERNISSASSSEVHFTCTHKFFLAGTTGMMQTYLRNNPRITLHLRNDMYASTRSHSQGEFHCTIDLSQLQQTSGFDATINILPTHHESNTVLTPREAAAIAKAAPYMSVSVHLSQLKEDPEDAMVTGNFLELSSTKEGLQVLRKVS